MENQTEIKWYQKPNGVIILLIFFFPVGLYQMWKNKLWTKQTRLIVTAIFAVLIVANAGKSKGSENALDIGTEYNFYFDAKGDDVCSECDACWLIKFKDETSAELWSRPCSGSTILKSCNSDVLYTFDKKTNTLTILNINNSNVSSVCKNRFKGDWKWGEGKYGKKFYSVRNPENSFY